jgi:hypothetical protein
MSLFGLVRAVYPISIELTGANTLNPNVPHVTRAVGHAVEIHNPGGYGIFWMIKQLQPNMAGVTTEKGEVDASSIRMGSHR